MAGLDGLPVPAPGLLGITQEMFNTCMPGPTSSLEVLRLHIGGTRGPDALQAVAGLDLADIDMLAEALLVSLPRPADDVPPTRCGPS